MKLLGISQLIIFSFLFSCSGSSDKKGTDKTEEKEALTICQCALMKRSEAPDECLDLQKQWKAEYEAADVTTKEQMVKEMTDCLNKK